MDTPSESCLTDLERVWLAAIMDGEGCIGIFRAKRPDGGWRFSPCISFTNTSKPLMDRFVELTEPWITRVRCRENGGSDKNKPVWTLEIKYWDCATFLHHIRKHLVAKTEQADLMLEFLTEWRKVGRITKKHIPRFNEFYIRSRLLNRRGTKPIDVEALRNDVKTA